MTTERKGQYLTIGNVTVLLSIRDQFCKNGGIAPRMGQVSPTTVPVVPMVTMVVVMPPKKSRFVIWNKMSANLLEPWSVRFVPVPMPGSVGCGRPVGPAGPGARRWPRCCCSAVDGRAETARVALDWVGKRKGSENTKDKHTLCKTQQVNTEGGHKKTEAHGGPLWFSWIPSYSIWTSQPLFIHNASDASTAITQRKPNDTKSILKSNMLRKNARISETDGEFNVNQITFSSLDSIAVSVFVLF